MKRKVVITYDSDGDFLEIMIGKPKPSYYKNLGDDIFQRVDSKTDEIIGFALYNVKYEMCALRE